MRSLLSPLCLGAAELVYPQLFPNYFAASLHRVPLLLQGAELRRADRAVDAARAVQCRALPLVAARARMRRMACAGAGARLRSRSHRLRRAAHRAARSRRSPLRRSCRSRSCRPTCRRSRSARTAKRFACATSSSRSALEQTHKPELLIWPETALQFVLPFETKSVSALLAPLATPVLFGGLAHRVENGKAELYNSAYLAAAGGHVLGRADKQRLIPFAEYIPFGDAARACTTSCRTPARSRAAPRRTRCRFATTASRALICYEDVLPDHVRDVVRADRSPTCSSTSATTSGSAAAPSRTSITRSPSCARSSTAARSCAPTTSASAR